MVDSTSPDGREFQSPEDVAAPPADMDAMVKEAFSAVGDMDSAESAGMVDAMLSGLSDDETTPEQAAVEATGDDDAARAMCMVAAGMLRGFLESVERHPAIDYGEELKVQVVNAATDVLYKYREMIPLWFVQYRLEAVLVWAILRVAKKTTDQISDYRKAQAELEKAKPDALDEPQAA